MQNPELESAAMLLATPVRLSERWRLLVREVHVPTPVDYVERTSTAVRLSPAFALPIEKKAKVKGWSLAYYHTHPHQTGIPRFSSIDDSSEISLGRYASSRNPNAPHVSLLLGRESVAARVLGRQDLVRVLEVGRAIEHAFEPSLPRSSGGFLYDRQVRAFGEVGQHRLRQLVVAIVGVGGTGSVIVQQLAHLGVEKFVLIDPDIVEKTNLNRLVGARLLDVGVTPKVEVGRRGILSLNPNATVIAIRGNITDDGVGQFLRDADFVFCCTDSHASRHVVNQFAYQYLVPVVDMGVAIHRHPEGGVHIVGRITMIAPTLPCLWCAERLNPHLVRQELMSEEQKRADPYFSGGPGVPQPAVISVNSTVASLAVTMFLAATVGIPSDGRHLIYDGNRSRVSELSVSPNPTCSFCSPESTAEGGDEFPLPLRASA